jgi:glutathione synthase
MKIALQMDPIEAINFDGDSSFVLGLGAQELGHQLFYYQPKDLFWLNGTLCAHAAPLHLRREKGNHFSLAPRRVMVLEDELDVILLRQDPPYNMGYLTTTYVLETIAHKVRVVNDPAGVRNAPEKMLITHFAHYMPPTLISSDADDIEAFAKPHDYVVAKKIYGHGGRDVYKFARSDPALLAFAADHLKATGEPIMLQPFLPEIKNGDTRVILFNGESVGALKRIPAKGNFIANLAQGGAAEKTELTARDKEICNAIAPTLRAMGLYFVGIDLIGDYLIEINTTSPTGLQSINRLYGLTGNDRMEMRFWKGLF